jgi:hypothetical protein
MKYKFVYWCFRQLVNVLMPLSSKHSISSLTLFTRSVFLILVKLFLAERWSLVRGLC